MKKNIFLAISLFFNVLLISVFFALFFFSRSVSFGNFTFFNPVPQGIFHNAFIISLPAENSNVVFGTAEFYLRRGTVALIQLSSIKDGTQSNHILQPLFDHSVISVSQSSFGLIIEALEPGQTTLQTFSIFYGFIDLARIIVYD